MIEDEVRYFPKFGQILVGYFRKIWVRFGSDFWEFLSDFEIIYAVDGSLVNKKACCGKQTDSKAGDAIIKIVKYFNIQYMYRKIIHELQILSISRPEIHRSHSYLVIYWIPADPFAATEI